MKLTTKKIMFILMIVLLVLVILMGYLVIDRVLGFFGPVSPQEDEGSVQVPASSDASSVPDPWEEDPNAHKCDYTIQGETFAPTCDTLGYTLYSCECGRSTFKDYKAALGHKYGEYSVVAATCTTDGWTERTCERCKKTERTDLTTASHSFGDWTAAESTIHMQRACSECGVTEMRSLDEEQTWVLRLPLQEIQGTFAYQQVVIDLADSDEDITCDVYIDVTVTVAGFDYVEGELTVSCLVNGESQSYTVPSDTGVLTVHADGSVTTVAPEPEPEPTPEPDPEPDPTPDTDPDDGESSEETE